MNMATPSTTTFYQLPEDEIERLTSYIIHREGMLDKDMLPYADPRGKDVLIFGCGYGNDALWAVRHGVRSILCTDLSRGLSPVPFERAMERMGLSHSNYEFRVQNIHETALGGETFDLILSNGVFEHIMDLKGVLGAFRPLLRPGGRVAIFADTLWYSSRGGHIRKGPWEHLYHTPEELRPELDDRRWDVLCNHLNRMTATDFLEAVRAVGMIVLQLGLRSDPDLRLLPELLPRIAEHHTVSPSDLSIVSIGCELCFVENL
jgi:SAM-dependent methyltransferase